MCRGIKGQSLISYKRRCLLYYCCKLIYKILSCVCGSDIVQLAYIWRPRIVGYGDSSEIRKKQGFLNICKFNHNALHFGINKMTGLPQFPSFSVHSDENSVGVRWIKYVTKLENLFIGLNINSRKRKKALLFALC